MTYVAGTLSTLAALSLALLGLLYTLRRWAIRYRQAPATMDINEAGTPPILNAEQADIDEWTTELELELRDHLTLNEIEEELRDQLDDAYTRFLVVLGVDAEDLLDHPGFVGVRELVGTA